MTINGNVQTLDFFLNENCFQRNFMLNELLDLPTFCSMLFATVIQKIRLESFSD